MGRGEGNPWASEGSDEGTLCDDVKGVGVVLQHTAASGMEGLGQGVADEGPVHHNLVLDEEEVDLLLAELDEALFCVAGVEHNDVLGESLEEFASLRAKRAVAVDDKGEEV